MTQPRLSKVVQMAFDEWIKPDTWWKAHPSDEARFHAFVWAVITYSRQRRPAQSEVRALIWAARGGIAGNDWLEAQAVRFSSLYETLYEFGKARNARRLLPMDLTQGATAPPA